MKTDEQEVINFLLTTEIIPLCLRIMESGSELSKTVGSQFHHLWSCWGSTTPPLSYTDSLSCMR